ncbi:MAG TPA: outer membrane protein assembly factor BamD [Blastocatellia bacterium]|nr:outer membrane protein assembly factor BamD [Blastocatellia bacterium]
MIKHKILVIALVAIGLLMLAGCGAKDKVKNENAAAPGRDKELYDDATIKAKKGRFDESRLLYNTLITSYAESEYLPLAKLAIADSFYLEGGTSNLEQAIGGYKEFAQFFPTHPKICEVKHQIAHALMRQMGAYNRDATKAKASEYQLKAAKQSCQNSPLLPVIENDLRDVQQVLGLHELDIARFYINNRQAYKAGESRLRDIITQYPAFSYFDESLYLLGVSLIEQEQPEEASDYFTRLVRDYPNSEFSKKGREYLEKLGKPMPEPANNNPAPERPSFVGKFGLILGYNGLDVSKDGVLLSRGGEEKEDVKSVMKSNESGGSAGTKAISASTKRVVETPAETPTSDSGTAPATPAATTASGAPNGPAAPNGEGQAAASETSGDNAKPEAKDAKKKDGNKKEKEKDPKKKKGVLGIFR